MNYKIYDKIYGMDQTVVWIYRAILRDNCFIMVNKDELDKDRFGVVFLRNGKPFASTSLPGKGTFLLVSQIGKGT